MNQSALEAALKNWMLTQNYTTFTTLAFNTKTSLTVATQRLSALHARLDEAALGSRWSKKPLAQRVNSISFPENVNSNLHFHMLWHSPNREAKLIRELPNFWQELVAAGDADMRVINNAPPLFDYCTKQTFLNDYILSADL